ncbi:MAG: hypothetical protein ACF8PG_12425 [Maioricimonas sp. JB045]|uniref:hypothetical protein n=1 Tax=Maioricimonas sp. JC845 TaxID=3232138 RepID=UPI003457FC61
MNRVFVAGVVVLVAGLLSGCGQDLDADPSESQQVSSAITGLNDAAGQDEAFLSMFVDGAAPAERGPYATVAYEVVGEPSVSGDEATVDVKIIPGVMNSMGGDKPAKKDASEADIQPSTQSWTLQKVGGTWKLKDAPIQ